MYILNKSIASFHSMNYPCFIIILEIDIILSHEKIGELHRYYSKLTKYIFILVWFNILDRVILSNVDIKIFCSNLR